MKFHQLLLLTALFGFGTCSQQESVSPGKGHATFSLSQQTRSGGRMAATTAPAFVLLSIEDSNGKVVVENKKLSLFAFGQDYISESIEFNSGIYRLTKFMVLNAADTIIYATPVEGSILAKYVSDPLPIGFTITKDGSTQVMPQVLAVTSTDAPSSFGYVNFGFEVVTPKLKLKQIFGAYEQDTINYSYAGNSLTSVFSSDGLFLINYYYDSYGKLIKMDRYQDKVLWESLIYLYDSIGRLKSITIPPPLPNSSIYHRIFSYTNGRISEIDVRPGELSFHEKRFIEYDSASNPVKITIHGYDSNDQESWVTTELYTFDTSSSITNSSPTDLFMGLTYVLPTMNHFTGLSLSHNITSIKTNTYWLADNFPPTPLVTAWSVFEYNELGYPIKETIHTSSGMAYYPLNGTVKHYVYE